MKQKKKRKERKEERISPFNTDKTAKKKRERERSKKKKIDEKKKKKKQSNLDLPDLLKEKIDMGPLPNKNLLGIVLSVL
jgi:hypothetical protein